VKFTRRGRTAVEGTVPQGWHFDNRSQAVDGNHLGVRWSPRYGPMHPDISPLRRALNGAARKQEKTPISLPKLTFLDEDP
jgi:hypothetical protein